MWPAWLAALFACSTHKCSLIWWDNIYWSTFLREKLLPCLIHPHLRACSVLQKHYKAFQCLKLITNRFRMLEWSPHIFQISHAVFLPRPAKDDTVSHPLNACIKSKTLHFSGPRDIIQSHDWKLLPVPKANLSPSMWISLTAVIASINTSESSLYYK